MKFTSVTVRCTDPDYLDISWAVDHPGIDPAAFRYTVGLEVSHLKVPSIRLTVTFRTSIRCGIISRRVSALGVPCTTRVTATREEVDYVSEPSSRLPRAPLDGLEITRLHNLLLVRIREAALSRLSGACLRREMYSATIESQETHCL